MFYSKKLRLLSRKITGKKEYFFPVSFFLLRKVNFLLKYVSFIHQNNKFPPVNFIRSRKYFYINKFYLLTKSSHLFPMSCICSPKQLFFFSELYLLTKVIRKVIILVSKWISINFTSKYNLLENNIIFRE